MDNLANAILILGVIYFYLVHQFSGLGSFLLVVFAVALWHVNRSGDEYRGRLKSETALNNAKAKYYLKKAETEVMK